MDENKSLERRNRNQLEIPTAVPVSSYPLGLEEGESAPSLLDYWRVIQKRRWTILSILLLVVVTVMIGTLKQRPVYRAKTVLQIDRESPNILSFQGFVAEMNPYDDSYLETAYKVLQSRSLAYRVINKLNLAESPEFAEGEESSLLGNLFPGSQTQSDAPLSPEEELNPKYTDVIDNFLDRLQVNPIRRSQLVEIVYESYDPPQSARITNTIAANYIDMNLEAKWDATQKASDWLSQQLVGLKAKLEKSEEDLQRYAKENSILFLDEKQSMNSQKLQQLQEEATRAQSDLIQKESLYNQIRDGDYSSVPGILENKLYQDLSLKLNDLRREYSELSATFTEEYPRVQRLKTQIDQTAAALDRERQAFAQRVANDYKAAANRSRLLDQAVAQQTREFNAIAEKSIQYNILKREADTNKQLYDGLLQRLKEASVSAGLRASNVRVVDPAEVPQNPAKPRKLLNLAMALIIGLSLGVGTAFLQEYLDNTLKTPEDVQRYLHLPTLGVIPAEHSAARKKFAYGYGMAQSKSLPAASGNGNEANSSMQLIGSNGNSALSEAYRSLRTSVLLSTSARPPRVILITSGSPGEGKTTTAINLAISLVQLGRRVLVVDSDMRRPRVGPLLQLQNSATGLSTYLTGKYPLDDVISPTSIQNLYAIPCGPIPPNPAELLSSKMMQDFLEEVAEKFEYVILDSPPVLHVSDARILAAQVEAAVLVVHGGVTPREGIRHAKQYLQQANANIIGILLNNVDFSSVGYDYYYRSYNKGYGYGSYSSDEEGERRERAS
ncbi:MAG: polysaccharide biosynthesis tyrosine autokinase [Acidobacteria bacterium]|nr:polysaccharide biosynthesis tyrosine autokinase [Acidobacteriota bacterium]